MYYRLTNTCKKRFVNLLKEFFVNHGRFNDVIIQTNYAFEERPKYSIVVRASSGNYSPFSMDNVLGTFSDCVTLAHFKGVEGNSIAWAKTDTNMRDKIAPSGYYIVKIDDTTNFHVEPYLFVDNEVLTIYTEVSVDYAQLVYTNINENSDIITSESGQRLSRGYHYTINYSTGLITFINDVDNFGELSIYYEYILEPSKQYTYKKEEMNNSAIEGVVIAFSDDVKIGDEQVVVVDRNEGFAYQAFGGKWELQFELMVTAQDSDYVERLTDLTAMELLSSTDTLIDEGIAINRDISFSGEAADEEDPTAQDLSYSNSITFSAQVDWEIRVPILRKLTAIEFENIEQNVSDQEIIAQENDQGIAEYESTWRTQQDELNPDYTVGAGSGHINGIQMIPDFGPYINKP